MSQFLYTLPFILSFALVSGLIKFEIQKKSITTFITVTSYCISSILFYFGYLNYAVIVVTLSVLGVFYISLTRDNNENFLTKKYNGHDRRHKVSL